MQSFNDLYTCYCDSILFINPKGEFLKELNELEASQHKPYYMIQEEEEKNSPPVKKKTTKKNSKKTATKKNPPKKDPPVKKAPAKKIVEEKEYEETLVAFSLGYQDDWEPTPLEGRNYCYLLTKGVEFITEINNEIKRKRSFLNFYFYFF